MFFIPDETYKNAIINKEKGILRALLVGIIGADPTFATTEFEEAKNYIKEESIRQNGIELILEQEYIKQEDEYVKEETEWDEAYYQMQLVWLRDNFALSERMPKIKKIGAIVYQNKKTFGKSKFQYRNSGGSSVNASTAKKATVVRATDNDQAETRLLSKKKMWWVVIIVGLAFGFVRKFFF